MVAIEPIVELGTYLKRQRHPSKLSGLVELSLAGFTTGLLVMYSTALLVKF